VAGDELLRAVNVEVCDESCEYATAPRTSRLWSVTANGSPGRIPFPFSFGVAPFEHDASRRVEVRVSALRRDEVEVADAELFTVRRQVGFTAGRTTTLPIFLAAACIGHACPEGFTCNATGECEPIGVEPADAGVADAGVADAGDGGSGSPDAGVTCLPPPLPASLGVHAPMASWSLDLSAGAASTAIGTDDGADLYIAGRTGMELFVGRWHTDSVPLWRTAIAASDTLWFGQVTNLVRRGEVLYGAGIIGEGWGFDGGLDVAAPTTLTTTDSRRHGAVIFALDAATGTPMWAHSVKRLGVTEAVGGLVVDEAGLWVATNAIGGTVGELQLDGTGWTAPTRGTLDARATLLRFGLDGTAIDAIGISSVAPIHDIGLTSTEDGVIVAASGGNTTGAVVTTSLASHSGGAVLMLAFDRAGAVRWARGVVCSGGSMTVRSVRLAADGNRAWLAMGPSTQCAGELRLRREDGSLVSIGPAASSTTWLAAFSVDACTGEPISGSSWAANVPGAPIHAVNALSADRRGIVLGGYIGHGGADFGGGALPARDSGSGTDGFVVGVGDDGSHVFSSLVGGTGAGAGPEDGVYGVLLRNDGAWAVGGFSRVFPFVGSATAPSGATLLVYALE
ncbi:MAG: hypothetical protein AB7S26_27285, partial [Sandaracinaceae bacterium]